MNRRLLLFLLLYIGMILSGCVDEPKEHPAQGTFDQADMNPFASAANRILDEFREQVNTTDQNKMLNLSGFSDEFKDLSDINTSESFAYTYHQAEHYFSSDTNAATWGGTGTDSNFLGDV